MDWINTGGGVVCRPMQFNKLHLAIFKANYMHQKQPNDIPDIYHCISCG